MWVKQMIGFYCHGDVSSSRFTGTKQQRQFVAWVLIAGSYAGKLSSFLTL
jgi:hypothetical protein